MWPPLPGACSTTDGRRVKCSTSTAATGGGSRRSTTRSPSRSDLPRFDRRPVRADLGPGGAELGSVEAERDDGIPAFGLRLLHEAVGGVLAARCEHLRHALELAADERLQRGTDHRADIARADSQPEHLAEDLLDLVARELVHSRNDHALTLAPDSSSASNPGG